MSVKVIIGVCPLVSLKSSIDLKDNGDDTVSLVDNSTSSDLTKAKVTFSYSYTAKTTNPVTVTASTEATGYTMQTSKDGKSWSNTASQTFTENGTMYARLTDGTNVGEAATANVTNIVKSTVSVSQTFSSKSTSSITVKATGIDTSSSTSKLSYKLYTSTSPNSGFTQKATTTGTTGNAVTLTASSLSNYTTYYYYVTAENTSSQSATSTTLNCRTYCPGYKYESCSTCGGSRKRGYWQGMPDL